MRLISGLPSLLLRLLSLLLVLWALGFFMTWGTARVAWKTSPSKESTGVAAAKEALVLAEECLAACIGSAPATASDPRVQVVHGGRLYLEYIHRHSEMRQRKDVAPEIIGNLGQMSRSLGRLCLHTMPTVAEARRRSLRARERQVPSLAEYNQARLALDRLLPLSETERLALIERLQPVVEEARRTAEDLVAAEAEGSRTDWIGTSQASDGPAGMKRQKRALKEEEDWRERQRAQRDALHRDAIASWWRSARSAGDSDQGRPTAAPNASTEAAPQEWEARYRSRTSGTHAALARVSEVLAGGDRARLLASCRALYGAVSDVLRDEDVLSAPNPEAGRLLKSGYQAALEGAQTCMADETGSLGERIAEAQRLLARGIAVATAG